MAGIAAPSLRQRPTPSETQTSLITRNLCTCPRQATRPIPGTTWRTSSSSWCQSAARPAITCTSGSGLFPSPPSWETAASVRVLQGDCMTRPPVTAQGKGITTPLTTAAAPGPLWRRVARCMATTPWSGKSARGGPRRDPRIPDITSWIWTDYLSEMSRGQDCDEAGGTGFSPGFQKVCSYLCAFLKRQQLRPPGLTANVRLRTCLGLQLYPVYLTGLYTVPWNSCQASMFTVGVTGIGMGLRFSWIWLTFCVCTKWLDWII